MVFCHLQRNFLPYITKVGGIASVNYLRRMTYGTLGKNRKFEDFLISVKTSPITLYERFSSDKNAYHWLWIRYLSIFSDPLTLEFPLQRHKNLFLCKFHGRLEENRSSWKLVSMQKQVSREILGIKAALR